MIDWLIGGIVLLLIVAAVYSVVRARKQGGGCADCASCKKCTRPDIYEEYRKNHPQAKKAK